MKKEFMKVCKILNHNTIICNNNLDVKKYVCFGKGIGFNVSIDDDFVIDGKVESFMTVVEDGQLEQYDQLVKQVKDEKLISIVSTIVNTANREFDNNVSSSLHYTLLDHLYFALEREKQNIKIEYPFLNDLEYIYPKEYEFSKKALEYINKNYSQMFPESELGFIILHIHSAITHNNVSSIVLINQICHECTEIIERNTNQMIDIKSLMYIRFRNHLQTAIHRVKNKIEMKNILLDSIIEKCEFEFKISEEIGELLQDKYHLSFNKDELGYLALHIYNLTN